MFTLFLPGIESASSLPRLPMLEKLLARGRAKPLRGSAWTFLAELAGSESSRWPVGPVSALGELMNAPRACCRVEPLGADAEQRGMFRLPAAALGIEEEEARELARAFGATFAEDGLRLELATPERWYLAWDATEPGCSDWRGFPGPAGSVAEGGRPSPPEPALRRLLSEVELLFHAHPVNESRRERGVPVIATLHPWGGGSLQDDASSAARAADAPAPAAKEEPYLAGLRRLGVVSGATLPRPGPGELDPRGFAWPLPGESLAAEHLQSIEQEWAMPLARLLNRGRLQGVRIVTGRMVCETRRADMLRFWRRARPLADVS